ncbi:hypothetical protein [Rhodospirillum centenum]|uniref:Uncharacterized protein n=1 Tax=Rhodospirillum centenum (strain ATCC 51521 / SW) TaxID=414684 RepID=B6ITA8_RHOCS|nr:hypothetical protein [Rhodospirillum centenum]ACI99126.1 hypothetical protein RC1_1729 [Rhodospirillum centenum SW]
MPDLSQESLGQVVGLSRSQIARFDGAPLEAITPTVDHALRLFVAVRRLQPDFAGRVLEGLNERDDERHGRVRFTMAERRAKAA